MHTPNITQYLVLLFFVALIVPHTPLVHAQSATELQVKIDQRSEEIKTLEKEIATYQKQITQLNGQVSSLASTLKSLELNQKKLEADIKVTENKVIEKNIEIQQLGLAIGDKEDSILDNRRIIAQSYVAMNEYGARSLPELLLENNSLSQAWNALDDLGTLHQGLTARIANLQQVKSGLETNKRSTEKAKADLVKLTAQLKDQRSIVLGTVAEKNTLLKETKNSEAGYSRLLIERQKQKEAFEREVTALESALRIAIDPSSIPRIGTGVLSYPIGTAETVRITQKFGTTDFSTNNPSVYKGSNGDHNGVDFGASIGTQIKAAGSGTVINVINITSALRCGYGNWVAIKHPNGLTTLYAHLSLNTTRVGDQVATGQIIGYSGNTGFTTGPHLHFGVYASQGFQTARSVSCPGITIPIAPLNAYLNPLSYL